MELSSVLHLGSRNHERWSIQREVLAVTETEVSLREALAMGLSGRNVLCWDPGFWHELPESCRRGSRTVCFFHHNRQSLLGDPDIVAGICMNRIMQAELRRISSEKPVHLARVGGVDDARDHSYREHGTDKIRLLVTGMATAPLVYDTDHWDPDGAYPLRKSPELLAWIAERLDRDRYAWVFVGSDWQPYVDALRDRGWTVIFPGLVPSPLHYRLFGEGDIYLMLARLEGGPLPLLETMGIGMWPICTPTGMAPEIIRHGINGYMVSAYDGNNGRQVADEVANLIQTLTHERLQGAKMSIRASIEDRTWPNFKRDIEEILVRVFTE